MSIYCHKILTQILLSVESDMSSVMSHSSLSKSKKKKLGGNFWFKRPREWLTPQLSAYLLETSKVQFSSGQLFNNCHLANHLGSDTTSNLWITLFSTIRSMGPLVSGYKQRVESSVWKESRSTGLGCYWEYLLLLGVLATCRRTTIWCTSYYISVPVTCKLWALYFVMHHCRSFSSNFFWDFHSAPCSKQLVVCTTQGKSCNIPQKYFTTPLQCAFPFSDLLNRQIFS